LCGKLCPLLATIRDGRHREAHAFLRHKDGHRKPVCVRAAPLRDEGATIIGAVETFHDDSAVVDTRRHAQELERASMRDSLTGVGNRRLGEVVLDGHLQQHRRLERPFGVLFIDIDRFKNVNDTFGHETGDDALRVVAHTLAATSRNQDQVIRWGGEEFLVLIADADSEIPRARRGATPRARRADTSNRKFSGLRCRIPRVGAGLGCCGLVWPSSSIRSNEIEISA
jgi:diguanylate cyclase (GGDEF)-like protein